MTAPTRDPISAAEIAEGNERFARGELVFVWHFNHDRTLGFLHIPLSERVWWINNIKPECERPTRLGLLRIARGDLPDYAEVQRAFAERWRADDELRRADAEWRRVAAEWRRKNRVTLIELHERECGCGVPWDADIFAEVAR